MNMLLIIFPVTSTAIRVNKLLTHIHISAPSIDDVNGNAAILIQNVTALNQSYFGEGWKWCKLNGYNRLCVF